jgi:xanthine dehydrogenase YagT iron-sulfur-binding subunit
MTDIRTGPPTTDIALTINGGRHELTVDNRSALLDVLRERLGLTGSKKGCDHGQCGACTVLIDGRRSLACLTLAVSAEGSDITTIEGVADGEELHPVQRAFLERDAYQCGYCTPGQICSAIGMLQEARDGWPSHATEDVAAGVGLGIVLDDDEVRERMSGNLCRCGAYANIVPAILDAAEHLESK